jgi:plastocyanin
MLRRARQVLALGVLMAVLMPSAALAATQNVTIIDFAFVPKKLTVHLGDTVVWTNTGNFVHNSSSDDPLRWWNSPPMSAGQSFTFAITAGGTFAYHCIFHPTIMIATVKAKDQVRPGQGPAGTVFTVTVATVTAPSGFVYDVQMQVPGGQFQDWMLGVTTVSVQFDSSGQPTGQYKFRSRLHRLTPVDGASGYSPPVTVTVT